MLSGTGAFPMSACANGYAARPASSYGLLNMCEGSRRLSSLCEPYPKACQLIAGCSYEQR